MVRRAGFITARTQWSPNDVKTILGLGPRLGIPATINKKTAFDMIADVEHLLEHIDADRDKDMIRSTLVNGLEKQNSRLKSIEERMIDDGVNAAESFIKQHPELLILKADKGNSTFIVDKEEHYNKARQMIADTSTYERIRDPTNRYMNENREFFQHLWSTGRMSETLRKRLTTYTAIPPRIYFLPKYHKEGMPLRPIVSTINTVTYEAAKFATSILGNLQKSAYHIRNSFDFQKYITNEKVPTGYIMVSFDVISLFTSPIRKCAETPKVLAISAPRG